MMSLGEIVWSFFSASTLCSQGAVIGRSMFTFMLPLMKGYYIVMTL